MKSHNNQNHYSNIDTRTTHQPGALIKNSRFECLNDEYDRDKRRSEYNGHTRNNNYTYQEKSRSSSFRRNRFSFLTEKSALIKKNQSLNIRDGKKFPTLGNIKSNIKKEETDKEEIKYTDLVKQTEEEVEEQRRQEQKERAEKDKQRPQKGWVYIARNNGKTVFSENDRNGDKKIVNRVDINSLEEHQEDIYNTMSHDKFQQYCGEAMYNNLANIQASRDEENAILGVHSRYWNRGSLTDLSYLSDPDYETEDSDAEGKQEQEYYSDCETY